MPAIVTELPRLTTDLDRCKTDLERHGYCLLADALSPARLQEACERLSAQAAAERERGVAYMDGAPDQRWGAFTDAAGKVREQGFAVGAGGVSQRLFMLLNKGRIFQDIVLMEQALELVGLKVWNGYGRFDTPTVELVSHDQLIGELTPNTAATTSS